MASILLTFDRTVTGEVAIDYAYDSVGESEIFYALGAMLVELGPKRMEHIERLIELDASGKLEQMYERHPLLNHENVSA